MNFFWVYDMPNWQFALLTIFTFVFFALLGLFLFRKAIFSRIIPQAQNDVVSFFMAGLNAMYGITLGLIAVAAWENFSALEDKVANEAAALGSLAQDIKSIPSPLRDTLKTQLLEYVEYTITDAWPQQRQGKIPKGGTERLTRFQHSLETFEPTTESGKIILAEAFRQLNQLITFRRLRLNAITDGLPAAVWYVIFFGAMLNIVITWFFVTDKLVLHVFMVSFFAALLGSLVFLVAAMDNPFRGEFSVGTEAFELILENLKRK